MLKQVLFDQYPILTKSIVKPEPGNLLSQLVVDHLHNCIDQHPDARCLAEFDHYSHTYGLNQHSIADDVIDARCVIFCFGTTLTSIQDIALCPQSIGIYETRNYLEVAFLMTSLAHHNKIVSGWISSLSRLPELTYGAITDLKSDDGKVHIHKV